MDNLFTEYIQFTIPYKAHYSSPCWAFCEEWIWSFQIQFLVRLSSALSKLLIWLILTDFEGFCGHDRASKPSTCFVNYTPWEIYTLLMVWKTENEPQKQLRCDATDSSVAVKSDVTQVGCSTTDLDKIRSCFTMRPAQHLEFLTTPSHPLCIEKEEEEVT